MNLLQMRATPQILSDEKRRPNRREPELRTATFDVRQKDDSGTLTGCASAYNVDYPIYDFIERFKPGACSKTISDKSTVMAFADHDTGKILGNTGNASLRLWENEEGLQFEIKPPDTTTGNEWKTLVRDKYATQMSIGFSVIRQTWTKRSGLPDLREIEEVHLMEVSIVAFPANGATHIEQKSESSGTSAGDTAPSAVEKTPERAAVSTDTELRDLEFHILKGQL